MQAYFLLVGDYDSEYVELLVDFKCNLIIHKKIEKITSVILTVLAYMKFDVIKIITCVWFNKRF